MAKKPTLNNVDLRQVHRVNFAMPHSIRLQDLLTHILNHNGDIARQPPRFLTTDDRPTMVVDFEKSLEAQAFVELITSKRDFGWSLLFDGPTHVPVYHRR